MQKHNLPPQITNEHLVKPSRRDLIQSVTCLLAAPLFGQSTQDVVARLRLDQPGPQISRHIYGQFIEHLGGVIYDGIWVGPESKIPNIRGIRQAFVEAMKQIRVPNFRWPGGCFADEYHWRDGIGPREQRPRTYNMWQADYPGKDKGVEPNAFGTHEFIDLCRLTGAEPYLAANVGSGSPREFHEWVLYCNAPEGTVSVADLRVRNGAKEPFNVRYWGVGNEPWGCGGNFKPEEYATEYRRFVTQYPYAYGQPFLIAAGPNGGARDGHLSWTRGFFQAMQGHGPRLLPHGWALHYYTGQRRSAKLPANSPDRFYDVLEAGLRMDTLIEEHWKVMGEFDKEHRTKLVVDEWGVWQPREEQQVLGPRYVLSQHGTLRDALHAALTLDIFNRHAEKLAMCNLAQTINCLHSLFAARGDQFVRLPTYYVFAMYQPHMDARRLPLEMEAGTFTAKSGQETVTLPRLAGSASRSDQSVLVTLVNPHLEMPVRLRVELSGGQAREARAQVLTHEDPYVEHDVGKPEVVQPRPLRVDLNSAGTVLSVEVPAHAVVAIQLRVA